MSWFKCLLFCCLLGCAQVTSLNLQKHQFGKIPTKIVWIQVAGLSAEHLAMLKYAYPSAKTKTAFEQSLCMGNTWEYSLYDLRPNAQAGFLSQLTGKKNIKNSCDDYGLKPVWDYLSPQGYRVGIFEGETSAEESLLKSLSCKEHQDYLDNTVFWKMGKTAEKKSFHANEKQKYAVGEIYYDKSCSSGECFTTLSRNVEQTFREFERSSKNFLYVIRNFKYASYLKQKKIAKAKAELSELNAILGNFQKLAQKDSNLLILVSSASAIEVDFPKAGREWQRYERSGKHIRSINRKLLSTLFVSGARAENFCGVYDQSEIMSRIFSGAKQQGLEFSIINPFE